MIREFHYGDTEQLAPHFRALEFQCKCTGRHAFKLDDELVEKMEQFFTVVPRLFGIKVKSINVSSGYRCPAHDKSTAVGGSGTGQHTLGKAADFCIICEDGKPLVSWKVCIAAQEIGFRGIARITDSYTHCDTRNGKWYGDETKGNSFCIPCADFYEYFTYKKEDKPMTKGIDVSFYQSQIDWSTIDVDFAILKAGQRNYTDPKFEQHYKAATAAGIPVGAYWYLDKTSLTEDAARKEADEFIKRLEGKQFGYPVFLDLEESNQFALGKEKVTAMIKAFLSRVESAGYWVGLYMSKSQLEAYVDDYIKSRYCVWVAQWDVEKPTYNGAYGLWQYKVGQIAGIKGDVDLDYAYVDYPTQIKAKGLNGFGQHPPADTSDDNTEEPTTDPKKVLPIEIVLGGKRYVGSVTEEN